jgi:hypothetical protein
MGPDAILRLDLNASILRSEWYPFYTYFIGLFSGYSNSGGWLTVRSAAFAQHTKSIPATTKQRWVARPCGACKGAGFSGVSGPRGCGAIRKKKEKK